MDYTEILKEKLTDVVRLFDGNYYGDFLFAKIGKLRLKIEIPKHFPLVLPKIYIHKFNHLRLYLPHVEKDGLVCFSSDINYLVDEENSELVLLQCVNKTIKTIEEGLKGSNRDDFRKEFVAFWDKQENQIPLFYLCEPSLFIKSVDTMMYGKTLVVLDKENELQLNAASRMFSGVKQDTHRLDAYYVPIRNKNSIMPPKSNKTWSKKDILRIVKKNVTGANKRNFLKIEKRKSKHCILLILDIPIEEKLNNVIIGFLFTKQSGSIKDYKGTPRPVLVQRHDDSYLVNRTSGEHYGSDVNIAIVGVGSVGSKIAETLGPLGVKKMTLIDNDYFQVENLYRNYLGADSLKIARSQNNFFKVDLMQEELEKKFPYLCVEVESMNVLDLISIQPDFFKEYDYVFVCIGDTMAILALINHFSKSSQKVFYSWLEPYGIGGHTLFVNYSLNQKGCFNCLYTESNSKNRCPNRASLVKDGQIFERTLASCRSKFIPYNAIASTECAINAIKLFHKVNQNSKSNSTLFSWIGEGSAFENLGYQYSYRYALLNGVNRFEERFYSDYCKVCGGLDD
ncbi:ThiF family adenylyltransferase [Enterococcus faecium]|nr:ThiF family adenylyltransferase [Enterococcus faecium]